MPDDETVNQMIARSEEEFDLFMVRLSTTIIMSINQQKICCKLFVGFSHTSAWTLIDAERRPVTHGENPV